MGHVNLQKTRLKDIEPVGASGLRNKKQKRLSAKSGGMETARGIYGKTRKATLGQSRAMREYFRHEGCLMKWLYPH